MALALVIIAGTVYYLLAFTPKNSVELYEKIHFADDYETMEKLMLEGYEDHVTEEDFAFLQENSPNTIKQLSVFEYNNTSYVVMTTPGTQKLEVLEVEELPEEVRNYFLGLPNQGD
ncbi:hypothetical protein [Ornithinibacillus halophilus]|uniref:Uncharacterized protein n=1 Tax=Ornithinibacillus halophilus TaxID=930117 RepID=A0A1M5N0U1_9BACI|nr:hypothetical protein [Ornithinibacillus halophilus]SHG82603.1 hypothetical protein SAMN05216225_10687 [Ornithinibacillus halophilus]